MTSAMKFVPPFLLVSLMLATQPAFAAPDGIAYVVNSAGASISVIDMAKQTELRRIPILREPHHLVLSPDGRQLLVGDTVANEMLFLDPKTGEVKQRLPMADPYQLGFSPNGKFLVVNGLARNQIDVYDGTTMKLVKRFPISSMPSHLAFSPDSSMVFVSLQGTDRLVAIDLGTMAVRWNQPVGKTPAGVMWHNGQVMVANMGSDNVAMVDPVDGRVTSRIVTGKGAHTVFLSPDGKVVYVNNRVAGTSVALDATTLKQIRSYAIPGGPDDMDFAPDGKIWITRRFAEKLAILDPVSGQYQTIDVGRSPHGIWLNPKAP
jgi:DNA-binding beta-propeller fold protein YncE